MSSKLGADGQHDSDLGAGAGAGRELTPGKQTLTGGLGASPDLTPGKRTLTGGLEGGDARAVQARGGDLAGPDVAATADRGVAGASSQLPHFEAIQQSFGRHDLSGVRAQVGGDAAAASKELGAEAYATGDRVAFAAAPNLHTAAHEAAHVVQQAGGVQLKDGLGQAGDRYEQHADAVADAVVAGRSAEGMLDGFAAPSKSAAGGATQRKVVQRVAAVYKSAVDLKAMDLSAFDAYASSQADWATSTTLGTDKEKLRSLLAFARKSEGLVLGACGDFKVDDLLMVAAGQGKSVDASLTAYSRAAGVGKNAGTIHIEAPATTVAQAVSWGESLLKLEKGIGGLIIERVIPQNATYQGLKALVDGGAVDDFATYYKDVKPLLDAENGREIRSYLLFHGEGGQAKYAGYKGSLPEIRNYHRFTVPQLDALAANRVAAAGNKAKPTPLPVCVVLQTAFDHNGAFHRDPYMTTVINRVTHITLFAEGKDSLGAFGSELTKFAAYGKDGKVDEVMVAGHGNAKLMELAGDKRTGRNSKGTEIYGTAKEELVSVDPNDTPANHKATDDFIKTIKSVLRDDPNSRVVLNACLTASNSVDGVALDPDPDKAAKQIRDAIAADPSLATAMKTKLGTHQGQVRGANASFGQVSLLDGGGNIDIVSGSDPKLTAPKLEYAEGGIEPTGVLRATLEAWGTDRVATIDALKRRIAAKGGDTSWREKVICSLMKLIVADQDNAALISTLTGTAGALGHLTARADCKVSALLGQVPAAHMDAIFTDLGGSDVWTDASFDYVPAVVFQVWIEKNNAKIAAFLSFLDSSTFTTQNAAAFFDLAHLKPLIKKLLPTPPLPPAKPPRGSFLIALLYLVKQGTSAPQESKDYIKGVVGVGSQAFPGTSDVDDILKGATPQRVLEDAGVVAKASVPVVPKGIGGPPPPVGPTPNLAPTGAGNNTLAVDSVTQKCTTYGLTATNAYMLPAGTKIGTIASGTTLNVIGTTKGTKKGIFSDSTNVDFLAVEYALAGNKTVFVEASDVTMT